ncbi:hypothetical protein HR065_00330, partial [Candidatus Phytoplasma pruni]|nr:hypothetical protein [Candidatus Phytoplasma pruni]
MKETYYSPNGDPAHINDYDPQTNKITQITRSHSDGTKSVASYSLNGTISSITIFNPNGSIKEIK